MCFAQHWKRSEMRDLCVLHLKLPSCVSCSAQHGKRSKIQDVCGMCGRGDS